MKLVCLSDNHTQYNFDVPDGDVLVHAGDFTYTGKTLEIHNFITWFKRQPHKHKVWVPGNHELSLEDFPYNIVTIENETGSKCLHNDSIDIEGTTFSGTAYTPEFRGWAYNLTDRQSQAYWETALAADVLVTHGPPYGVLDAASYKGRPLGCKYHYKYLERHKPKLNIFGHIHFYGGQQQACIWENKDQTICANVAILGEDYKIANKPTVLTI